MRDLDKFLNEFKDNNQAIPHSFTSTIRNFSPKSKESRDWIMKVNKIKKSIIVAISLLLGSGIVFATSYDALYEKIFKEPVQKTRTEIISEKTEITDENKEQIKISQDEAKEIVLSKLKELNYENIDFSKIELIKLEEDELHPYYRLKTKDEEERGIEVTINSTTKEIKDFIDWDLKYAKYSEDRIKEEEAIKLAKETISKIGVNLEEYDLYNSEEMESYFGENYRKNWDISFCKFYDGLANEKESVEIFFFVKNGEVKINDIHIERDNYFEENSIVITEEKAIEIAKNKEKEFSNLGIKDVSAELSIENMNSKIYELEKGIEFYELVEADTIIAITRKEEKHFETENVRRRVWKVTIKHEEIERDLKNASSITEYIKKYCDKDYYIDATTGEIIGGDDYFATGNYSKDLIKYQFGEENYLKILEKCSRKEENTETVNIED